MINFKKRFLSSVVALAMVLSSFSFTALAEGAEITKIYADSFGIDVLYSETPDASAYDAVSFALLDGTGEEVAFTPVFDEDYNTLHINFDEDIELDKEYLLTIGDVKKIVTVNTYDFLDFENTSLSETNTAYAGIGSKAFTYGAITSNTLLGASGDNKKLLLDNKKAFGFSESADLIDSTISLKAASYMNSTAEDCWTSAAKKVYVWKGAEASAANGVIAQALDITETSSLADPKWGVDDDAVDKKSYSYGLEEDTKAYGWFGDLGENGIPTTSYTFPYTDLTATQEPAYKPNVAFRSYASDKTTGIYDTMVTFIANGDERPVYQGTNRIADTSIFVEGAVATNGKIGNTGSVCVGVSSTGAVTTVDDVLVTTCTVSDWIDDAVFENDDIYADLYGVQIQLETPASIDQRNNTVVTDPNGDEVEATVEYESELKLLNVHFDEPIDLNTYYDIDVNGIVKTFKVTSAMSEDFESEGFDNLNTAVGGADATVTGKDGLAWTISAGGVFATESEDFNASENNRKVALYHGNPRVMRTSNSSIVKTDRTGKFTYYAQTQLYAGTVSGRYAYMFVGGWTSKSGAVVLSMDNMNMQISRTTGSTTTGWPTYDFTASEELTYGKRAGNGATDSIVGRIEGFEEATGAYTSATKATPVNHAMRIVGRNYSAYADMGNGPKFTGTLYDAVESGLTTNTIGVATSVNTGFLVVDDILVTTCTVEDYAEQKITKIYADSFGIDILCAKVPAASDYENLSFVAAQDTNKEIAKTVVVDSEYKTLHINFDEEIKLDEEYILTIGDLKKSVTVNTYHSLDFENVANLSETEKKDIWGIDSGKWYTQGGAATSNGIFGASSTDKKMLLDDKSFAFNPSAELVDSTISLKAASYITSNAEDCWTSAKKKVYVWKGADSSVANGVIAQSLDVSGTSTLADPKWGVDDDAANKKTYSYNLAEGKKAYGYFGELGDNGAPTTTYTFPYSDVTADSVTQPAYEPHIAFRSYASDETTGNYDTMVTFVANGDERPVYQGTNRADATLFVEGAAGGGQIGNTGTVLVGVSSKGAVTVVDDVLVTTCTVVDYVEPVFVGITKIYADIYGVDVVFDAPAPTVQRGSTSVSTKRLKKLEATKKYDADTNTLHILFDEPIDTNTEYVLTVGDIQKTIMVNELFAEDFEEMVKTDGTTPELESIDSFYSGTFGDYVDGFKAHSGTFLTADSRFGAKTSDKKLAINAGMAWVSGLPKNSTITAKTSTYQVNGDNSYPYIQMFKTNASYNDPKGKGMSVALSKSSVKFGPQYGSSIDATNSITTTITGGRGTMNEAYGDSFKASGTTTHASYNPHVALRTYGVTDEVADVFAGFVANGEETPVYQGTVKNAGTQYLTEETSVAGFAVNNTSSVLVIDDVLITDCTVSEYVPATVQTIYVQDIWADKDAIYVEFDKDEFEAEDDFTGIKVVEGKNDVDYTATVDGKVVTIVPDGGVKSNEMYTVTVPNEFAPSEFATTDKSFSETFKLTVYAQEDFAGNKLNSEDVAATNAMFDNERLVLRDGTLSIPSVATAKDYVVEFKATVYSSILDRAIEAEMVTEGASAYMDYEEAVPNLFVNYNANQEGHGSYRWFVQKDAVSRQYVTEDGVDSEIDSTPSAISFGDAINNIWDFDNTPEGLNFYKKGDDLINVSMFATQYSTHEPVEYSVKFDKAGKAASYYLDGALVSSFAGDENDNVAETGEFSVVVSDTEYVVFDDIFVYSYEEFEDIAVTLDGTSITVENITSVEKPVVIIVAAYTDDNMMLDAWVSTETSIDANGKVEDTAKFTNATGATKYKAFVWDNMSSLIPYCVPVQYTLPTAQ